MEHLVATDRKRLQWHTKKWVPGHDLAMPIRSEDIPNFSEWIRWNAYCDSHPGFDFAAYIDRNNDCVLGLPRETPVRAIAAGVVTNILPKESYGTYHVAIFLRHGIYKKECRSWGPTSSYVHVAPRVAIGQVVRRGQIIALLHEEDEYCRNYGELYHLHFELGSSSVDPEEIYGRIAQHSAYPQGSAQFSVQDFHSPIRIANLYTRKMRSLFHK